MTINNILTPHLCFSVKNKHLKFGNIWPSQLAKFLPSIFLILSRWHYWYMYVLKLFYVLLMFSILHANLVMKYQYMCWKYLSIFKIRSVVNIYLIICSAHFASQLKCASEHSSEQIIVYTRTNICQHRSFVIVSAKHRWKHLVYSTFEPSYVQEKALYKFIYFIIIL